MDIKKFYSKCFQGNVLEAINYLESFENNSEDILELKQKYLHRFITQDEVLKIDSKDPWIEAVLKCYYKYYISVLTNHDVQECEKQLIVGLAETLMMNEYKDLDEIEARLESIFGEKGYCFLGGKTSPYRGPYIWKTTNKEDFLVELPCGIQKVTVFFISEFIMLSWLHFATFGKHHTGGWAKEEGIYYVNADNKKIDTHSADFQVWFLKHEAQHLSDYVKYPNLDGSGLEYRAKLVELIYHPDTFNKLETYINQSKNDNSLAHPYAAFLIINGLSNILFGKEFVGDLEKWKAFDSNSISKEALNLFMENERVLSGENCETRVN